MPTAASPRGVEMGAVDNFWGGVLGHIRERQLIAVVGPDITVAQTVDGEQTLSRLIGERLMTRYDVTDALTDSVNSMSEAVNSVLREHGKDELDSLYRVINDVVVELDAVPGQPLRDLASIEDLRLFVSTTPDRLLADALHEVRADGGYRSIRELTFAPRRGTEAQELAVDAGDRTHTAVLRLFGELSSIPQYAIHEEDRLEWIHALLSNSPALPGWFSSALKGQPMLFIGCELPDWLGRFLLRLSSSVRLSDERKQFFFAGCSPADDPTLSNFLAIHCRKHQVQQLDTPAGEFVAELRERWEALRQNGSALARRAGTTVPARSGSIFISYMREDIAAARRLRTAIEELGGDVWLDEHSIDPGDNWRRVVLNAIRESIRLFIPVISSHTEMESEGYVFREWDEAVERSRSISGRRFIVPVVVDGDYDGDPRGYRNVPDEFRPLDFGRAPDGDPHEALVRVLTTEIRAMRKVRTE